MFSSVMALPLKSYSISDVKGFVNYKLIRQATDTTEESHRNLQPDFH